MHGFHSMAAPCATSVPGLFAPSSHMAPTYCGRSGKQRGQAGCWVSTNGRTWGDRRSISQRSHRGREDHTHGNEHRSFPEIFPACILLETNGHAEQQARTRDKSSISFCMGPGLCDGVAVSSAGNVYVRRWAETLQPLSGSACLMFHEAPWKIDHWGK